MLNYQSNKNRRHAGRPAALDEHTAAHVADLFGSFSDASRVRIVSVLVEGPTNVGALAEAVGLSESAVSHHLRWLRQMRLVHAHKEGRLVFYTLDDHVVKLFRYGLEHVQLG
jgi:DNA-binding transcriptional ArsR family regulator